jgi:very-short-patch-repair endonuclease
MRFNSCRDVKPLPFDFYIPSQQALIEYDGSQHFEQTSRFDLAAIRRHDAMKTGWARHCGLRLIRIPYFRFHLIGDILQSAFS